MHRVRCGALTLIACALWGARGDAQDAPGARTSVGGIVFDSLEMTPLRGAVVQIADANGASWSHSFETGSDGRFRFADVPAGTYLVGFFHSKLDALSLTSPTLRIDVRTDKPIQLRLTIPSARTIARSLCGPKAVKDSTGLLMGYLRGADNAMPRLNGTVRVRWSEIVIEKRAIRRTAPAFDASSGPTGLVAICGIPLGTPVVLQAASESDSSGAFELTIPSSGFLHRDIFVAPFAYATSAGTDSAPGVNLLRGTGRLRGKVVGGTGRAIPGARVMLWGTGIETTTNGNGEFFLEQLPGGTHTIDVRAIGFTPVQQPVDIVQTTGGATEIELTGLGITLDTVRVTARLYTSKREAAFERRMRTGQGHVYTQEDIEKRRPMFITDLLRMTPGVRVVPSRFSGQDVLMRADFGMCRPELFIDGVRQFNDPLFPIDYLVPAQDLRAVEVYARSLTVPAEFSSMSGCGVVAIWTGPRRHEK
jgi:hypothetical protein